MPPGLGHGIDMTDHTAEDEEGPASRDPVVVDPAALSPEALRGLVESFVLREGTDYGRRELGLEEKVRNVMRQLARGEARIFFDPGTGTVDIQPVPASERGPGAVGRR